MSAEEPLRVLVSFDEKHYAYGEALSSVITPERPHIETLLCKPEELDEEVDRFDPYVVVTSEANNIDPGGRPAGVELAVEAEEYSRICVAGTLSEEYNSGLSRVLSVVDEADQLVAAGQEAGGC